MTLGDEEREVAPGDCVVIPPGAVHGLVNTGDEPLVWLCCCAPAYTHEDTVLVDGEASSG
jgi:mannose-6-phosphate isomerase-like protein (cupin superfamily)